MPLGLAVGFFVALAKQSERAVAAAGGNIYTTIFRGLPELLTLFIVYLRRADRLQQLVRLFDRSRRRVNGFIAGMVALGVVFSAYASEVFLSAFRAIPRGQYEGGDALGLPAARRCGSSSCRS